MEVCRACLALEEDVVPLNEGFVNAYNLLTSLNVAILDSMPQYVCQSCVQTVTFFVEFRERCIATETSLQDVFQKVKQEDDKPLSELKIKQEIKEEKNFLNFGGDHFDNEYLLPLKNENHRIDDSKSKKQKLIKKRSKTTKKEKSVFVKKEPEENLSCGLCNRQFTNHIELSTHIESHKDKDKCGVCSIILKSWPTMVGHRFTHIPQKEYKCHVCKKALWATSGAVSMEYHYMIKHYDGEKTKLFCKICNRGYDTPRKLGKHVNSAHSKKCLVCDYCKKTYNNKQRLLSHIKCHSENRSYVCELCGFASKHSSGLKDHKIRKHEPAKVKCSDCLRWFANATVRDKHVCTLVSKICPICGIQFNMTKNYNRHMRCHSSVKSYKCPRCPAAYRSQTGLTGHLNRHDNIRPQKCPYCPLKFFTQSVLIKHKRIHTGEKPYVCKICNKGFTGNHNLKVHMKVHGEYLVVKRSKPEDFPRFPFPAASPPRLSAPQELIVLE